MNHCAIINCCRCLQDFEDNFNSGHAKVCLKCRKPKDYKPKCLPSELIGKSLTPRESQITDLIRSGMPNKEIAWKLHLAEGTIKVFLSTIFRKTGTTNRTELAVKRALKEI